MRKTGEASWFKDLENVKRYDGKDGFYRFVCGEYDNIEEAVNILPAIRKKGYHDAFVMPVLRYDQFSLSK